MHQMYKYICDFFSAFKPTELKTSAQVWNGEEDIFHLMSIKLLFLHLSISPPALVTSPLISTI